MRLIFRQAALDDLIDIERYTLETWSADQVAVYLTKLAKAIDHLMVNPTRGKALREVDASIRRLHVARHYVLYRPEATEIIVLRILHDSSDYIPVIVNLNN
jgi:toxin ParE1/3/4